MTKILSSSLSITSLILAATALSSLTGCNNVSPSVQSTEAAPIVTKSATIVADQTNTALSPAVQTVVGDYASTDYGKRAQGYDWVAVIIRPNGNDEIDIKVRARSDVKKPSCTFDGKAKLLGQDNAHGVIFQTVANDSATFLQFKNGTLTLDSEDKYALNYFCSGGATLAGDYQKLNGNLELS